MSTLDDRSPPGSFRPILRAVAGIRARVRARDRLDRRRGRGRRVIALVVATAAALAAGPAPASAGVAIGVETRLNVDGRKQNTPGRLLLDGEEMRTEGFASGSRPGEKKSSEGVMIFRAERPVMWVLDPAAKTYAEIDARTVAQMRTTFEAARGEMQAQLEKLSPEKRALAEKAMQAMGGAGDSARPRATPLPAVLVPTGGRSTISGFACRIFDVRRGTTRIAEACVAAWTDVGIEKADLEPLRKFAAFQREMAQAAGLSELAAGRVDPFEVMDRADGLPVGVVTLRDGKREAEMRVVSVKRESLDPGLFEVPTGYTARNVLPER